MARIADFSPRTRQLLRDRAGNKCSVPWCRTPTSGPAVAAAKATSSGRAAHIFSSAAGGPRGQGGLSVAELSDIANGIWCCSRHADLIDVNRGEGHDAPSLRAYTRLAEALARVEQGGAVAPGAGWLSVLHVRSAHPFAAPFEIHFGKYTIIVGGNATGKTAIADMIAGLGKPHRWSRWRTPDLRRDVDFEITYFDPTPHQAAVTISHSQVMSTLDAQATAAIAGLFGIVRISMRSDEWRAPRITDFKRQPGLLDLAAALDEDPAGIATTVAGIKGRLVHSVRVTVTDEIEACLPFRPGSAKTLRDQHYPWGRLGHTGQLRVGLEAAIAVATERAKTQPTVLVVDDFDDHFDEDWRSAVLERLSTPGFPFQVVVLAFDKPPAGMVERWVMVNLSGSDDRVEVREAFAV